VSGTSANVRDYLFLFFFHFVRWICIIIHVYVNEIVR
jgi:hypothetical protein